VQQSGHPVDVLWAVPNNTDPSDPLITLRSNPPFRSPSPAGPRGHAASETDNLTSTGRTCHPGRVAHRDGHRAQPRPRLSLEAARRGARPVCTYACPCMPRPAGGIASRVPRFLPDKSRITATPGSSVLPAEVRPVESGVDPSLRHPRIESATTQPPTAQATHSQLGPSQDRRRSTRPTTARLSVVFGLPRVKHAPDRSDQ